MTGNFDDKGLLEMFHPRPGNRCNTERNKATHVRKLTHGEFVTHAMRRLAHDVPHLSQGTTPILDATTAACAEWIDANLICGNCGGDRG